MPKLLAALLLTPCLWSQSFEVASIRLHTPPVRSIGMTFSGPKITIEAMSLDNLITEAYDLKDYQLAGVPAWGRSGATSDRYDISAKAEGDAPLTRERSRPMLQALLADRFQLKFHRDSKEFPVYFLVPAKTGPKLKESAPPDAKPLLTMRGASGIEITATHSPIEQLVNQISNHNGVDRPVVDKTNLKGAYDYTLTWMLDKSTGGIDPAAVSIALEEQLGLKLEPAKARIETMVVDRAEKPSDN